MIKTKVAFLEGPAFI